MNVNELLDTIEDALEEGANVPLSGGKKIVDVEQIRDYLDENREAVNIIMRNCKACGVFDRSRVNIGEAARYLSACREQFDIVLLDPPFRNGTLEKILPAVDKCTAPGGIVLCESETGIVLPAEAGGLTLRKQYKYGRVLLWKYTKPMQPASDEQKGEAL